MPEVIVADVPVRYGLLGPQAKLLLLKVPRKNRTLDPGFTKRLVKGKTKREPVAFGILWVSATGKSTWLGVDHTPCESGVPRATARASLRVGETHILEF